MSFIEKALKTPANTKYFTVYDMALAGLMFLIAMVVYTWSMTPSVSAGDNGELTTAMYFLGIAHAPGYPLHSLIGKLITFIPINNVGWRANFFSVVCGAVTIYFCTLVYLRLLMILKFPKLYAYVAAFLGAFAFMVSETLWSQAIMAEVYTMSAIFHPVLLLILMRWYEDVKEHEDDHYPYFGEKYLYAYGFLFGVAMCGHQTVLGTGVFGFAFIAYGIIFHSLKKRSITSQQVFTGVNFLVILMVSLGLAFYFYTSYVMSMKGPYFLLDNMYTGMGWFVFGNVVIAGIYLYKRFLAEDSVDPHNYLEKGFYSITKMFIFFYIGFAVNFYMFVRAHGHPPINWMGIADIPQYIGGRSMEGLDLFMAKLGKFFDAVWRKQFGEQGKLPFSMSNYMKEVMMVFTHIHKSQFTLPIYFVGLFGMIKLYFKNKLWFWFLIFAFASYILPLTQFLRFDFNDRAVFFVKVFYIFSYFIVSIPIAVGFAYLAELIGGLFGRQKGVEMNTPTESEGGTN